ncbi:MAG: Ppx/GppA phosphatase family protein [Wenzhouxiangella sp.]
MPSRHQRSNRGLSQSAERLPMTLSLCLVRPASIRYWLIGVGLLAVFAVAAQAATDDDCEPLIVAVFDIGSGTTRMQVADIAECRPDAPKSLLRREIPLGFAADLVAYGCDCFSVAMREEAQAALDGLVASARAAGAQRLYGVATAAFRRADNAAAVLEDWQQHFELRVDIIDQHTEGELAFTAIERALAPGQALVVWDIGAGSQQLVWRDQDHGDFRHHNSRLAAVSFRELALIELARPDHLKSPNPISAEEARLLRDRLHDRLHAQVPSGLLESIQAGAEVVGVGGVHGASLIGQAGLRPGDELSRAILSEVLASRLDLTDEAIGGDYADTQVTNLILVLALMEAYGIERYRATRADLTDALLIDAVGRVSASVLDLWP